MSCFLLGSLVTRVMILCQVFGINLELNGMAMVKNNCSSCGGISDGAGNGLAVSCISMTVFEDSFALVSVYIVEHKQLLEDPK